MSKKRILVIDSDRATRFYWRAKLATAGHLLVDEAATGEALRRACKVFAIVPPIPGKKILCKPYRKMFLCCV